MTTDNFISHNGGKCPVADGTLIDVKYRDDIILRISFPEKLNWVHYSIENPNDLIGWRLAEQPKQENEPVGEVHELSHGWECYIWEKAIDDGLVKDGDFVYAAPQNSAAIVAKLEAEIEAIRLANIEAQMWVDASKHDIAKLEAEKSKLRTALILCNNDLKTVIRGITDVVESAYDFEATIAYDFVIEKIKHML